MGIAHDQRVRRFVHVQAAVHRGLHAAAVDVEICHGAPVNAVLLGGQRLHVVLFPLAVGVQPAALGVDGGDQLRLALVLEAAQRLEGAADDAGGAAHAVGVFGGTIGGAHAVMDAAAPEHVFQRVGVVVNVEALVLPFHIGHKLGVLGLSPEIRLRLSELGAVVPTDLLPCVLEVGAEAGVVLAAGVVGVGVVQPVAEPAVDGAAGLLQPVHKAGHRLLHEHIQAVGRAAAVAVHVGNAARIRVGARLVILAQRTEIDFRPRFAGSQQYGGQTAHRHHRRQDQCHSPFRPFHVDTPCLISKLYGKRRRREGPPPIYITIVMCSIPSVCVVVYQKNEKNTKNMKILSPAPQDLGGFMARNGV